jgi:hypothetical protein
MKSAYERAMERFGGDQPIPSLSPEQKAALATIDDKFNAKVAEKELFLGDLINKAAAERNYYEIEQIQEQKRREIAKLDKDREEEKEKIRQGG